MASRYHRTAVGARVRLRPVVYNSTMQQPDTAVPTAPRTAAGAADAGWQALAELAVAPLWWYTGGLLNVVRWWLRQLGEGAKRLSLRVLLSHWLQPMYGQYDTAGRIISFVLRTILITWHVAMMVIWIVAVTAGLVVYLLLPAVAVWQLLANLA